MIINTNNYSSDSLFHRIVQEPETESGSEIPNVPSCGKYNDHNIALTHIATCSVTYREC